MTRTVYGAGLLLACFGAGGCVGSTDTPPQRDPSPVPFSDGEPFRRFRQKPPFPTTTRIKFRILFRSHFPPMHPGIRPTHCVLLIQRPIKMVCFRRTLFSSSERTAAHWERPTIPPRASAQNACSAQSTYQAHPGEITGRPLIRCDVQIICCNPLCLKST